MAWFGLDQVFLGVDLDAAQAQGDDLDARLAAENQRDLASGRYDQATYDLAERNRLAGQTGDVKSQVHQAFGEGWNDGARNISGGIGGFINGVVSTAFRIIPWQLWLIGLAAGAVYFWPVLRPLAKRFLPVKP